MREQIQFGVRPYVTVTARTAVGRPIIQLIIRNDGKSAAENLSVRVSKDIFPFEDRNKKESLRNRPFFKYPVTTFPPGGEYVFDVVEGWKSLSDDGDVPAVFDVETSYGFGQTKFEEVTSVDLRLLAGTLYPYDPIHAELEKIRKVLERRPSGAK